MAKKTGLGRGLDALFMEMPEEVNVQSETIRPDEVIQKIDIFEIEPNKSQPRRKFDIDKIEELAESIKRYGVIQPIIVTKQKNFYEIVAGERRWRAAKKAGLSEMPCIVRESDERKNKEIALIENIQREDLNPIEKARGFRQLLDEYHLTQQELSEILGIPRSSLANTVRILNLDQRVIDLTIEGKLTEGHCRSLMALSDPEEQYKMALKIIESGGTVRDIERKVQKTKKVEEDRKYEAIYQDVENRFQGFFGTKVKLNAGKKKGRIIIEYASNEDLERILGLIN